VGARTLTLPDNKNVHILAVAVGEDNPELKPATQLFDTLGQTEPSQTIEKAAK
jgi:hypothetical protein